MQQMCNKISSAIQCYITKGTKPLCSSKDGDLSAGSPVTTDVKKNRHDFKNKLQEIKSPSLPISAKTQSFHKMFCCKRKKNEMFE